jgi:predicted enzyme related to lactoylglutathione lyase
MSHTTEKQATQAIHWFEIPVRDLDRAQRFYETLFHRPLRREAMGPETTLAVFEYESGTGVGGCLYAGPHAPTPSTNGTVVYLSAEPSLNAVLARLPEAGGKLLVPRTELPEGMGAFAQIEDCEGNRVGLHAQK